MLIAIHTLEIMFNRAILAHLQSKDVVEYFDYPSGLNKNYEDIEQK